MNNDGKSIKGTGDDHSVTLAVAAERRLVRPEGGARHIDLSVKAPRSRAEVERPPLAVALVVDRSGSMQGDKLETAKRAARAVLDRLSERDTASVVVFDNEVDVILPEGPMTADRKAQARAALSIVEARARTALHEGWLTGCRSIAPESSKATALSRLSRCFLLTDGLANVGLSDPEQFAAQAAEVRQKTGICTSTFGIGDDYDEALLAPLAVAGSGQFNHLRNTGDMAAAFSGELSEMFEVTARAVRIEVQADPSVTPELISLYWGASGGRPGFLRIDLGDLIRDEERHVVVRLAFGRVPAGALVPAKARVVWREGEQDREGPWQELTFEGASNAACSAEVRDMDVMHWVGLQHAEKAKAEALTLHKQGQDGEAIRLLDKVMRRLGEYASGDPALVKVMEELHDLRETFREDRMTNRLAKEMRYGTQLSSRMQRDHRNPHQKN